jgi:hypothetical protein
MDRPPALTRKVDDSVTSSQEGSSTSMVAMSSSADQKKSSTKRPEKLDVSSVYYFCMKQQHSRFEEFDRQI